MNEMPTTGFVETYWNTAIDRSSVWVIETATSTTVVAVWTLVIAAVALGSLVRFYLRQPAHQYRKRRHAILGCAGIAAFAAWWIAVNMPAVVIESFVGWGLQSTMLELVMLVAVSSLTGFAPALLFRHLTEMITGRRFTDAAVAAAATAVDVTETPTDPARKLVGGLAMSLVLGAVALAGVILL